MTPMNYIKDKLLIILLNGTGGFLLSLYLSAAGNKTVTVILMGIAWMSVLLVYFAADYLRRRSYFTSVNELMEDLDQPYLVQEFMEKTWRLEDDLYQEILKKSNKAVIERIYQLEQEQKEYREFIEGWIHEVKLPMTGIRLAAHSLDQDSRRRIEGYITTLENNVEQALFYARSEYVYKDYMIQEMELKPVIMKLLSKNKYLLIQNKAAVEADYVDEVVYSDSKWVEFILNQILINAVKYRKEEGTSITFRTEKIKNGVKLSVRDSGIGIPGQEVNKVFEKGFTGTNGRKIEKSTGIGLYLCRKLCNKLGLEIGIESKEQEFTEVFLVFPKSSYLSKL